MLARKGETNEEYLRRRNEEWEQTVEGDPTVARIDADGEPDEVYRRVVDVLISQFGLAGQH
jgi:ribose 1,5-bisphosphokinase PhnN